MSQLVTYSVQVSAHMDKELQTVPLTEFVSMILLCGLILKHAD
jgi:hypothetical protein